jgi:hypothetical protein
MQDVEDDKPKASAVIHLKRLQIIKIQVVVQDLLVTRYPGFRSSILPTIIVPALVVTAFSGLVAAASIWWDKEVGLSNNVGVSSRITA